MGDEIWILKQDMDIKMCEDAVIRTARKLSVSLWYGAAVVVWASVALLWGLSGYAAEDAGAKPVVTGDNFTLTQKDIDAYRDFLQTKHLQLPPNELVRMVIQNELLSRAFDEEERAAKGASPADKKEESVADKMLHASQYQQKLLDDYKISDLVVESYYRSHPEKYKKTIVDGVIETAPLDKTTAEEIRFDIVEAKKQSIVENFVESLIAKYHIKTISG